MNDIEVTFRGMPPTDELVGAARSTCKLLGEAVSDRPRWHVLIEREGRRQSRAEVRLEGLDRQLVAAGFHADPLLALQHAFTALAQHPELGRADTSASGPSEVELAHEAA